MIIRTYLLFFIAAWSFASILLPIDGRAVITVPDQKELVGATDTNLKGAFLDCDGCATAAWSLKFLAKLGISSKGIGKLVTGLCKLSKAFPSDVCDKMVALCAPELLFVFKHTKRSSKQICFEFFGFCPKSTLPYWNIKLPGDKPPVVPRIPNKGPRKIRILQISDTHYDPSYAEGALATCDYPLCCRKAYSKNTAAVPIFAGRWGSEGGACDVPFESLELSLKASQSLNPDIVYVTGDFPPHDPWDQSRERNLKQDVATINAIRKYFPKIPVAFAIGNHEAGIVNDFYTPKVSKYDYKMDYLYAPLLEEWKKSGLPESATDTVLKGGYFEWSPLPGLRIVSLNTNNGNPHNWWLLLGDDDPTGQLQWLSDVLSKSEKIGEKVHIISHHDARYVTPSYSRVMNQIFTRFENTIVGHFAGHTHSDEMRVLFDVKNSTRPVGVTYVCPSLSSDGIKSPSIRMYDIDGGYQNATWEVIDSLTYQMNLTEANSGAEPVFNLGYSSKTRYNLTDLSPNSWANAFYDMAADSDKFYQYFKSVNSFWQEPKGWSSCHRECRIDLLCSVYGSNLADNSPCRRIKNH